MEGKKAIINQCISVCAIKWRNKFNGEYLESSSFEQYMKKLFAVFHSHDVRYFFKEDFNADGEFHAVTKSVWK